MVHRQMMRLICAKCYSRKVLKGNEYNTGDLNSLTHEMSHKPLKRASKLWNETVNSGMAASMQSLSQEPMQILLEQHFGTHVEIRQSCSKISPGVKAKSKSKRNLREIQPF